MKFATSIIAGLLLSVGTTQGQGNEMVKMCLFYPNESGHARSDPIINQNCASGHVHTFYGPQNFHPQTSYEDLRDTPARFSSTPFVENQSLYWHPSIYRVSDDGTYTRVNNLETSPYYRWDKSNAPEVVAFPPGFRMIAHSNDPGANQAGESGGNMLTECCQVGSNGEEQCETWDRLHFPTRSCGFLGIAMSMPTCWNDSSLGDDNDHKSHMAYTTNGEVNGPCPSGFNKRVPQVQLFVRIGNYQGGTYQLSDGLSVWHVDFFNGWQEGKLQELIDTCEPDRSVEAGEFNPPCSCSEKLTENTQAAGAVCDSDVRRLIIDEATDVTTQLPMGSCEGPTLIPKSWTQLNDSTIQCTMPPGNGNEEGSEEETENGSEEEIEEGSEEETENGSEEETEDGSEEGTEDGSEEGSEEEIEGGSEEEIEEGSEEETENGSEEETENGSEEETENGSEEGTEDGSEEETEEGSEEETEEGSEEETENGSEEETENESEEETEDASGEESEETFSGDEDPDDEENPEDEDEDVGFARSQSQTSCHLTCMDNDDECQLAIVSICEEYYDGCKQECHQAEAIGEIAEDELIICLDEWCTDDKQICYNDAETRCERRRRICLRGC